MISAFTNIILEGDTQLSLKFIKDKYTFPSDLIDVYEKLFKPSLYSVGELWSNNIISVADEHIASATTQIVMNALFTEIPLLNNTNKKALVTCIEDEQHQIGSKMVADTFELQNWKTYYLGANTPNNAVISTIEKVKPEITCISLSLYSHISKLINLVEKIKALHVSTQIIIGGLAFTHIDPISIPELRNTVYIDSLYKLNEYIKTIH